MIGRIIMSVVFLCIPAVIYYYKGFEPAIVLGICMILFMQVSMQEELRDTRLRLFNEVIERIDKILGKTK